MAKATLRDEIINDIKAAYPSIAAAQSALEITQISQAIFYRAMQGQSLDSGHLAWIQMAWNKRFGMPWADEEIVIALGAACESLRQQTGTKAPEDLIIEKLGYWIAVNR